MKKQGLIIMAGIVLIVILPIFLIASLIISSDDGPDASQGRLDLSSWDFARNGTIQLTGEWEFYRSQLLTPDDFQSPGAAGRQQPKLTGMVKLPGKWNDYIGGDHQPTAEGYATFRLRVHLQNTEEAIYGIRSGNIRTANRIFVNGQEAGASGTPGTSAEEEQPDNIPYVGFASITGHEAEIIVQTSNYAYASGGIFSPILFGDKTSILRSRELDMFIDFMSAAGFLIPALYILVLYRLRKKEPSLLYLGLFCLSSLIYVLLHGEKLLGNLWPGMDYEWFIKLQLFSSALIYFFLLRYVGMVVPRSIPRVVLRLCDGATVVVVLMALMLPTVVFSKMEPLLLAYSFTAVSYIAFAMFRGMRRQSEDAGLLLIGMLSILIIIVANVLTLMGVYNSLKLVPYEMLLFVITQAQLLSHRFARAFAEVEQLSLKLQTLDGLKDEFMANTSHELRTPLHGIVNIAQSLVEGASGKLNMKQARDLSMIVSTGKRLSVLINDILDFSKLKNGEIVLNRQQVDLRAITRSVMEITLHVSENKPIRFEEHWPEHLPLLVMDEERLRQILYNLLGNAVKFTSEGVIRMEAKTLETGNMVQFTVSDTGIGIAHDRLQDIFKSYEQVGATGEAESNGTGLGLSISKKLVELGGGEIWAESDPGLGSSFHFTLPAVESSEAVKEDSRVGVRKRTSDYDMYEEDAMTDAMVTETRSTLLLVDDDPVNLQALRGLLAAENCRLILVDNGADALEQIRTGQSIDLVITDWMMPDMSGIELCRAVRQQFSPFEMPVLMLTARGLPEDVRIGLEAGANDFLRKPVDADELRARVRNLIELRKSVRRTISTEMAFLQAQIKPHFLFNALNTIISLLPDDQEKTTGLLMELSHYLRGSFDFQNREQLTTLSKELALVHSYLILEKARFEERLEIVYDIDAEPTGFIPPLSIQPIVENAVRHGIMRQEAGGKVGISVREDADKLCISVTDNGVGMQQEYAERLLTADSPDSGVGLRNINTRLLTQYGKGLKIESAPGHGTTVIFEVPKGSLKQQERGNKKIEGSVD
ncbi:response regulator [Paenibacillus sp. HJL G12]|uniref:Circadian input-output histidine kinase CikA n=1 Tax=Paenibacillus dendrobii TaxID=2691084 RepID=A0A7X3LIV0_9BACL|nr:ATP-binding protein [Paenibacillus dendrobii]MWV47361.1 response regulator [Paenibacillus dendrobii]